MFMSLRGYVIFKGKNPIGEIVETDLGLAVTGYIEVYPSKKQAVSYMTRLIEIWKCCVY